MHSEYQQFAPDEPRLDPIWSAAAELGLIAFFHAGADIAVPTVRGTPGAFHRLLDRWPQLTVVLAHMGGYQMWAEVTEVLAGRDVWLDTSYTLGHLSDEEFVALIGAHGSDRVLFGSDGPWTDPAAEVAHLRRLGLAPAEIDGILGGNAERLLGSVTA
jgi:predicted TIM-barrel fold metal-dependent hydrolase